MQDARMVVESVVVVGLRVRGPAQRRWQRWQAGQQGTQPKRSYTLRPRPPEDCLDCWLAAQLKLPEITRTTLAWREVKSPRRRPKTYDSDGHAGLNPACQYYRDTDGLHHALRRDGCRNKCEATPQWECGACLSKAPRTVGYAAVRAENVS